MKQLSMLQTFLLGATVLFGLGLKTGVLAFMTGTIHKTPGILAMGVEIVLLVLLFRVKKTTDLKVMEVLIFLATVLAAFGGISTESASNYNFFYMLMALSGFTAFILSSIVLWKLRNSN